VLSIVGQLAAATAATAADPKKRLRDMLFIEFLPNYLRATRNNPQGKASLQALRLMCQSASKSVQIGGFQIGVVSRVESRELAVAGWCSSIQDGRDRLSPVQLRNGDADGLRESAGKCSYV
jgi:hypothetical protein